MTKQLMNSRMSAFTFITPEVHDPYFAVSFVNNTPYRLEVWLQIDGEWWAAPNTYPGARTAYIPALEGATVEWRVLSEASLAMQNLVKGTAWTIQDEEAIEDDDNVSWQGQFTVTYGMLDRTTHFELF